MGSAVKPKIKSFDGLRLAGRAMRPVLFGFVLALLWTVQGVPQTTVLRGGTTSTTTAERGVYVGSGCDGAGRVPTFNNWVGKPVTRGSDGFAYASWTNLVTEAQWTVNCWQRANLGIKMTFQIPMLPRDGSSTLALGAAGNYDTNFTQIGNMLVSAGYADAYLRVGWEFNGSWYPWAANPDPTNWVAFFRHIVKVMRAVPGSKFQFDWNPAWGVQQIAAEQVYPGDDVVDFIGQDAYDQMWGPGGSIVTDPTTRWNDLLTFSHGLNWLVTFSKSHNKRISIPEWGVITRKDGHGGGDDPYYVNQMVQWFQTNNVASQIYYDFNSPTLQSAILNLQGSFFPSNQFPQSSAAYQAAFR
jgi:hypothetical protein